MSRLVVMPIGDSITVGQNSTTLGGYRGPCFERRLYGGLPYTTRGLTEAGSIGERRMCGNSGERTDQVLARLVTDAATFKPDVALYHCGTNDCTQRNSGVAPPPTQSDSVVAVMSSLDLLRTANAEMYVLVALIVPNQTAGSDTQITNFNAALKTAVEARADYTAGKVVLVDMNAAFRANASWSDAYMGDVSHPNEAGYAVMAAAWGTALTSLGF